MRILLLGALILAVHSYESRVGCEDDEDCMLKNLAQAVGCDEHDEECLFGALAYQTAVGSSLFPQFNKAVGCSSNDLRDCLETALAGRRHRRRHGHGHGAPHCGAVNNQNGPFVTISDCNTGLPGSGDGHYGYHNQRFEYRCTVSCVSGHAAMYGCAHDGVPYFAPVCAAAQQAGLDVGDKFVVRIGDGSNKMLQACNSHGINSNPYGPYPHHYIIEPCHAHHSELALANEFAIGRPHPEGSPHGTEFRVGCEDDEDCFTHGFESAVGRPMPPHRGGHHRHHTELEVGCEDDEDCAFLQLSQAVGCEDDEDCLRATFSNQIALGSSVFKQFSEAVGCHPMDGGHDCLEEAIAGRRRRRRRHNGPGQGPPHCGPVNNQNGPFVTISDCNTGLPGSGDGHYGYHNQRFEYRCTVSCVSNHAAMYGCAHDGVPYFAPVCAAATQAGFQPNDKFVVRVGDGSNKMMQACNTHGINSNPYGPYPHHYTVEPCHHVNSEFAVGNDFW